MKKEKIYSVVRIIKEEFEVRATSKKDCILKIENPHTITVIKETIKEVKIYDNK